MREFWNKYISNNKILRGGHTAMGYWRLFGNSRIQQTRRTLPRSFESWSVLLVDLDLHRGRLTMALDISRLV